MRVRIERIAHEDHPTGVGGAPVEGTTRRVWVFWFNTSPLGDKPKLILDEWEQALQVNVPVRGGKGRTKLAWSAQAVYIRTDTNGRCSAHLKGHPEAVHVPMGVFEEAKRQIADVVMGLKLTRQP